MGLSKLTLEELMTLKGNVEKEIKRRHLTRRRAAVDAIHHAAREHGLTLKDVTGVHLRRAGGRAKNKT